jgi:hypothetical protein
MTLTRLLDPAAARKKFWILHWSAKGVFSQVSNCRDACHGSLWRFWLRGTCADEHRKCDEGLDRTFDLCHIFRREAPTPAMLHALKLWVDPFTPLQALHYPLVPIGLHCKNDRRLCLLNSSFFLLPSPAFHPQPVDQRAPGLRLAGGDFDQVPDEMESNRWLALFQL